MKTQVKVSWPNAWLLLFSQIMNIALLATQLSGWMLGIIALTFCWQVLALFKLQSKHSQQSFLFTPVMPKFILFLFAISGCVAIAISAKQLGVLHSMVHLLCFAYALKIFEMKQRKDFFQLWLLGVFVLASAMIFQQNLLFALLSAVILVLNLTVLFSYFSPQTQTSNIKNHNLLTNAKITALLLLQSVVLAVVLFIVFPRLSPFWQVPIAKSAKTGLSDSVMPGDIASLALSSDLAFRVNFTTKNIPQYSQLYWRAMTLEQYDGKKWTRFAKQPINRKIEALQSSESLSTTIDYQIIAEPSFQTWLFTLPLAVATANERNLNAFSDYTVQSKNIISQTTRYQLQSFLQAPLDLTLTAKQRQVNLAYPVGSNPKLERYAKQLIQLTNNGGKSQTAQQSVRAMAIAQTVLNDFRQQAYFYTLKPPLLRNNSLDQFYFDTKAGFCVHYASAFTFLMRAAGIPTRVVTGYLGGEFNNQSKHLSVYQYDAHAWSEIWLAGKGWQRIDPTAAVDPERVEQGLSAELLKQQLSLNNDYFNLYQYKQFSWINSLRLQLDALDYQWTQLVLSYSGEQQYHLLKRWFGTMLPWKTALIIAITLSLVMLTFWLGYKFMLREKADKKQYSAALVIYQQALHELSKREVDKKQNITVTAFAHHIGNIYPECEVSFKDLSNSFLTFTYKKLDDIQQKETLQQMKEQLSRFKNCLQGRETSKNINKIRR